jgi:beta-glucosidase
VRKSFVLLKNDNRTLPVSEGMNMVVARDLRTASLAKWGGWTISWQGTGTNNPEFPQAQSIFAGIRDAAAAAGGSAELTIDGSTPSDLTRRLL